MCARKLAGAEYRFQLGQNRGALADSRVSLGWVVPGSNFFFCRDDPELHSMWRESVRTKRCKSEVVYGSRAHEVLGYAPARVLVDTTLSPLGKGGDGQLGPNIGPTRVENELRRS